MATYIYCLGCCHIGAPIIDMFGTMPWGICMCGSCWVAIAMGFITGACWVVRCAFSCSQKPLVPPAGKPAAFHMRYGCVAAFCFRVCRLRPHCEGMIILWMPLLVPPMVLIFVAACWCPGFGIMQVMDVWSSSTWCPCVQQ